MKAGRSTANEHGVGDWENWVEAADNKSVEDLNAGASVTLASSSHLA